MLTIFQSPFQDLQLMQTSWAAQLNPLLSNPISNVSILNGVVLASGDNVINHKLGKKLQGWFMVGQNASATFYDKQTSNSTPQLTLVLNSSAAVTANVAVF
jgi:hypothetical protein